MTAHCIAGARKSDHLTPFLHTLHWLSVWQQITLRWPLFHCTRVFTTLLHSIYNTLLTSAVVIICSLLTRVDWLTHTLQQTMLITSFPVQRIGMCKSSNSNRNVVGIWQFFCKCEIQRIFRHLCQIRIFHFPSGKPFLIIHPESSHSASKKLAMQK